MTYNDDGDFWILVFNENDIKRKLNLNRIVNIDKQFNGMQTPLINCIFLSPEQILINYFDLSEQNNSYFIYNFMSHLVEYK